MAKKKAKAAEPVLDTEEVVEEVTEAIEDEAVEAVEEVVEPVVEPVVEEVKVVEEPKVETKVEPKVVKEESKFNFNYANKMDNVLAIVESDATFDNKVSGLMALDTQIASVVKVFVNYEETYKKLKTENGIVSDRNIQDTQALYSAIKHLLSSSDVHDLKASLALITMFIKQYCNSSLSVFSYACNMDKWQGAPEEGEDFLCIMSVLTNLAQDGIPAVLKNKQFNKFKSGPKLEEILQTVLNY